MTVRLLLVVVLSFVCGGNVYRLPTAAGEMFTAVVDLERVVKAEYQIAKALRAFAEQEQQRIDILKR
jgi:hypothetical protein